jgi:tetratricopeptide (TPR) repeat protein
VRRRRPPRRKRNTAAAKRYYQKGQSLFFAGNVNAAIKQYTLATRADNRYAAPYRALGTAYISKGQKAKGKRYLRTFLRLAPRDPMAKFVRKMLKN